MMFIRFLELIEPLQLPRLEHKLMPGLELRIQHLLPPKIQLKEEKQILVVLDGHHCVFG
jgi:hypothetical protein